MSCTIPLLTKADQVSGTFSDLGQRLSSRLKCPRAGSLSKMQLKASPVMSGVIFVPAKQDALLPGSTAASAGFSQLPPHQQALL